MGFYNSNPASQIVVNGTMTATRHLATNSGGTPRSRSTPAATSRRPAAPSASQLSLNNSQRRTRAATSPATSSTCPSTCPTATCSTWPTTPSFQDIDINAATLPSGTLALEPDRHQHGEPQLRLPRGFTVASGATLDVGTNVSVLLPDGQTLTDNGTLTFATGDMAVVPALLPRPRGGGQRDLDRHGTSFATTTAAGAGCSSTPVGTAASGCWFNLTQVSLDNSSVLKAAPT